MPRSALLLMTLSAAASLFAQGPAAGTAVTGAPYSATETTQTKQTVAGANPVERTRQAKIYRDNQGRVRTETTVLGDEDKTQTVVSIFDPVAGVIAVLNPHTQTVMKHPLPPAAPATPRPGAPQAQTTDLGAKTIGGLACTGKRTVITIPAGTKGSTQPVEIVREVWTSTVLKIAVQSSSSDPRYGTSTMELSDVSQTEPAATLFQIPANYTVNAPAVHSDN
jgi:hypothetical protein